MTRTWRPGAIDRYVFGQAAWRLLAIVAVVVLIMTLENAPRLTADLRHTDAPAALLLRLSIDLLPEHLAIALPVATLLAVALTVRALAGRGEWQMLAAAGMSPTRALAAPMGLAALAAAALLANALMLRPLGERGLDALYGELVSGRHGVAVPLREPVPLDAQTVLVADGAGDAPGELRDVLIRRGTTVMVARRARVAADGRNGIAVRLGAGVSIDKRPDGTARRFRFDGLVLHGQPPMLDLVPGNLRHRLERLGGAGLWRLANGGEAGLLRNAALAALLARMETAFFCLLLPWLAVAVGVPPRRRAGGPAMLVGIVLIVLHLQTAAAVEEGWADRALTATLVHAGLWAAAIRTIAAHVRRHGDGAIDLAIATAVRGTGSWMAGGGPLPAIGRAAATVIRAAGPPPGGGGGVPALQPTFRRVR